MVSSKIFAGCCLPPTPPPPPPSLSRRLVHPPVLSPIRMLRATTPLNMSRPKASRPLGPRQVEKPGPGGGERPEVAPALVHRPRTCLQWAALGCVYSQDEGGGGEGDQVRWGHPGPSRTCKHMRSAQSCEGFVDAVPPPGGQSGCEDRMGLWPGTPESWNAGGDAVAPLALRTSLTQEGPRVPGRAVPGTAGTSDKTQVPHAAVCFTETHAHALCSACPGLGKRGRLDTPWSSGKREFPPPLPERPGPF